MKVRLKTASIILFAMMAGFFMSCTENSQDPTGGSLSDENSNGSLTGKGHVAFLLTDAPFPTDMVAEANVTIDKIEIRMVADSDSTENDSTTFITVSEEMMEFNLLDLRNGVTAELTEAELDTGTYDLIRMHVVDANVVLNDEDSTTYDLKIPSGSSSGLKIKIMEGLTVADGGNSTVLLDFDVSKSFVVQGNAKSKKGIKGFIFKPVIRAVVQEDFTGIINGYVSVGDSVAVGNATVEFYQMDSLITSALTDTTGYYAAIGLPTADYDIKCIAEGYEEFETSGIVVIANDTTSVDILLTPVEVAAEESGE